MEKLQLDMREPMDILTRQVGRMLAVAGVSFVMFNLLYRHSIAYYNLQARDIYSSAITLGIVLAMFSMSFSPYRDLRFRLGRKHLRFPVQTTYQWLQVLALVINATIAVLRSPESAYGFPLMMIAGALSLKYRIVGIYGFVSLFIYFAVVLKISAVFNSMVIQGVRYLIFGMCCLLIAAFLYKDELARMFSYIDQVRKEEQEKQHMLTQALNRYEQEVLDPCSLGLTPREMEVLEILCLYRSTNQDLASRLGLRIQTVKTHMQRIFDKAGVDDRYQLIDLCRPFFFDNRGVPVTRQRAD